MSIIDKVPILLSSNRRVSDSFDRQDNLSSIGSTDTGQLWNIISGTWGIQSNKGIGTSAVTLIYAILDSGLFDCVIGVEFVNALSNQRLIFRYTTAGSNFYINRSGTNVYQLGKRVSGVVTNLATFGVPNAGDKLRIILAGSLIMVYLNGIHQVTVDESFNQTATMHGLGLGTAEANGSLFDNFYVEGL